MTEGGLERRRETHSENSGRQSLREGHSPRGKERGIERERGSKALEDSSLEKGTPKPREREEGTPPQAAQGT